MGLTGADYRRQLQALLPSGAAWPRASGATLTRFLDGTAEEFARIGGRVLDVFDEAVPNTTRELLIDWERVAGLPDNCAGALRTTVDGRRLDLVSKLSSTGGQSPDYFIAVAAVLGFDIDIYEYRPWRIGQSPINEPIYNADWAHVWKILAPETEVTYFRIGESGIDQPLRSWGNAALECRINQLKPAHTVVLFGYVYLYLTSHPYAVEVVESVGAGGSLRDARVLTQIFDGISAGGEVIGATLRPTVSYDSYAHPGSAAEAVAASGTVTGATLIATVSYASYSHPGSTAEAVAATGNVTAATLVVTTSYASYTNWPAESVAATGTITGATLQ